ncbi:hypothetical protein [Frankia sp. CiP3]|uniref:hypothetical protein n=1 Tax=Frankia sp. CiP3 TaxID=2880971 RepID=UPI001EF65238|nr:hypothetical protein [Frankia sp. CiP3]
MVENVEEMRGMGAVARIALPPTAGTPPYPAVLCRPMRGGVDSVQAGLNPGFDRGFSGCAVHMLIITLSD